MPNTLRNDAITPPSEAGDEAGDKEDEYAAALERQSMTIGYPLVCR
jgi:hypothetical protein